MLTYRRIFYPNKVSFFPCFSPFEIAEGFTDFKCSLGLQATLFNDANSEFDVLVASDAIGMGLNLNISRVIFSTMMKFDGFQMRKLTVPEIKQIAGAI